MTGSAPVIVDGFGPVAPRGLRGARVTGMVVLALWSLGDLLVIQVSAVDDGGSWAPLAPLAVCLAAVLWPVRQRPPWLTPTLRAAGPAALSLAVTAGVYLTGGTAGFGPAEALSLLCLLFIAVRSCPPAALAPVALLTGIAALALPFRLHSDSSGRFGVLVMILVLAALFAGLGGYTRSLDGRRRTALVEVRQAERLAMAADLHDFVAHHVTGILVRAQMAQLLGETEPERVGPILVDIEREATQALASMRRTVNLLRTDPDVTSPSTLSGAGEDGHRPVGDLSALPELLGHYEHGTSGACPAVSYRRDPGVPDDLPHEVQIAAFRVVQEGLTNIRKHAADATGVVVELHTDGTGLRVRVLDDGSTPAALPGPARGGGFGLAGLTERVTALGGHLHAGPRPDRGWEISAVIPLHLSGHGGAADRATHSG